MYNKNETLVKKISCFLAVLLLLQATIIPMEPRKAYASDNPTADIFPKVKSIIVNSEEGMAFSGNVDIVMHGEHETATLPKLRTMLTENGITYNETDAVGSNAAIVVAAKCSGSNCSICGSVSALDSQNALSQEQGYVLLSSNDTNSMGQVTIVGADGDGAFYGVMTLMQMLEQKATDGRIAEITVSDYPDIKGRGYVEGFYGTPWSYSDRNKLFSDTAKYKLNTYIYAPKDDPYHKAEWKTLYPDDEAAKVKELVAAAEANNVTFCWTIHPGSNYTYDIDSDGNYVEDDLETLIAKLEQVYSFGVRRFGVMYDDIYKGYAWGAKQANVINMAYKTLKEKYTDVEPMITVPTYYTHTSDETAIEYLTELFGALDESVEIMFTGKSVASKVDKEDFDWPRETTGVERNVSAWWNYPVNDMYAEETNLMLMGPLEVLSADVDNLDGFYLNPMNEAEASKVAIYSGGDYAWNTSEFDYMASWERAIKELLPEANEALQRFADNSSRRVDTVGEMIFDESRYLADDIAAFEASVESGDSVSDSVAAMKGHFEQMLDDIDILREIENTDLLEEIEPYLEAYERIAEAGILSMTAYQHSENGEIAECNAIMEEMPELIETIETTKMKGVNYIRVANIGRYRIIPFLKLALESYEKYTSAGVAQYFNDKELPGGTASVSGSLSAENIDYLTDKSLDTAPTLSNVSIGDTLTYTLDTETEVSRILLLQDLDCLSGASVSVQNTDDSWTELGKLDSNSNEFKVYGTIKAVKLTFKNTASPLIYELYIEPHSGDAPEISTDELSELKDELESKDTDLYSSGVASLKAAALEKADAVLAKTSPLYAELKESVALVKEALNAFDNVAFTAKLQGDIASYGLTQPEYVLTNAYDGDDTTFYKPYGAQKVGNTILFEFTHRIDLDAVRIYCSSANDWPRCDHQVSYTGDNWVTVGTITGTGETVFKPDVQYENVKYARLYTGTASGYFLTLNEITFKSNTVAASKLSAALEKAAEVQKNLYTTETTTVLEEAFTAAKSEIKNEDATYDSLMEALANLTAAQNALKKLALVNAVTEPVSATYAKENLMDGDIDTTFAVRSGTQEVGDTIEFEFPFKTDLSTVQITSNDDKYYLRSAEITVSTDGKEYKKVGNINNTTGVCKVSLNGAENVKYLRIVVDCAYTYTSIINEVSFEGGIFENENIPYEDALALKATIDAKNLAAYTDETVKELNDAITAFETICNEPMSTSEQAITALGAIETASNNLVKKPLDYTELNAAIEAAEASDLITNLHTEASKSVLTSAVSAAKEMLTNAEAEQTDVDAAKDAVLAAIDGLENVILAVPTTEITADENSEIKNLTDGDEATCFVSEADVSKGDSIDFCFEFATDLTKIMLTGDNIPDATVQTSTDGVEWSDAFAIGVGGAQLSVADAKYARITFTEDGALSISEVTFEGGIFDNTVMPFDKAVTIKNECLAVKSNKYTDVTVSAMNTALSELWAMCNSNAGTTTEANAAITKLTNAKNALALVKLITPATSIATVNSSNYLSYIVDGNLNKFYKSNESQKVGQTIDFEFAINTNLKSVYVYCTTGDYLRQADILVSYDGESFEEERVGWATNAKDYLFEFEEELVGVKKVRFVLTAATGSYLQINEVIFGGGMFDNDVMPFDKALNLIDEIDEIDLTLYTNESVADLNEAIDALIAECSNHESTLDTANAAIDKVKAKKEALTRIPRAEDITKLQAAIDASEPYVDMDKYTIASATAFVAAKETALAVIDDYGTTQEQVDEAALNLAMATSTLTLRKNIISAMKSDNRYKQGGTAGFVSGELSIITDGDKTTGFTMAGYPTTRTVIREDTGKTMWGGGQAKGDYLVFLLDGTYNLTAMEYTRGSKDHLTSNVVEVSTDDKAYNAEDKVWTEVGAIDTALAANGTQVIELNASNVTAVRIRITGYSGTSHLMNEIYFEGVSSEAADLTIEGYAYGNTQISSKEEISDVTLVFASYGDDDKMIDATYDTVTIAAGTKLYSPAKALNTANANTVKVFIWNNIDDLVPLCEAKEFNING